jgi:hypothetical protein
MALTLDLELPEFAPGWVWLAGAGPGDPGLLTLHALNGLKQADAVVYDALVDERVLRLARPGAALEYAGKRGGKPSPRQRDISARLVELARAGKRVLRLKGGDPFVFGRGGEEASAPACRSAWRRASPPGSAASPMPASRRPIATPTRPSPSSPGTTLRATCRTSSTGRRSPAARRCWCCTWR